MVESHDLDAMYAGLLIECDFNARYTRVLRESLRLSYVLLQSDHSAYDDAWESASANLTSSFLS